MHIQLYLDQHGIVPIGPLDEWHKWPTNSIRAEMRKNIRWLGGDISLRKLEGRNQTELSSGLE